MALIAMAVYDTDDNGRSQYTQRTLNSLHRTVDWSRHRLIVINNASCEWTTRYLDDLRPGVDCGNHRVIHLPENVGTARAINKAWKFRTPGEACLKIDNDVEIHEVGWLDEMEACLAKDPTIGILALKRRDLVQWPLLPLTDVHRSKLVPLPHERGERWLIVEKCIDVIGTAQLYNSKLLDVIGYLYQPSVYSFDDGLACVRSRLAGFWNALYPRITIDHIDSGGTPYTEWKCRHAGEKMAEFHKLVADYQSGRRPIYEGPGDEV